jgi:hypothetical protein
MPPELARGSTQDEFDSGSDATPMLPPLAWEFTEPADLLDYGWGRLPATASTSLFFAANLIGYQADKFDGKADCLFDGEPLPFGFSNNMLTATLDGLIVGTHTIFLNAGSGLGVASRALTFEVVDTPPAIQVGISETDGNLVVSFDRPMPASQLGDIARWNPQGFDSEKQNVTVLSGNMSVSIGMSYPLQMDDPKWFNDNMSMEIPYVEFESTLGISKCPLWSQYDDEGERQGQTLHCDKGDVTSEQCHEKLDWTFEWPHIQSTDGEERQAINTEDWPPTYVYPWSSCFTYNTVRHSTIGEGHLNYHLAANWGAQYDTVWESGTPYYSGVGYFGWHREIYLRNRSYYPPSWCDWGWELTVNCDNCMGDPGTDSKGFEIDEPMYVDHTPPEVEVEIVCGEEIHDRVSELISSLDGDGVVYAGNGQTGDNTWLYNYYWTYMGQYIETWLQSNPDGLCVIIQAEDPQSTEGNYLLPSISLDYETQSGQKICVDNLAQNFFYVDEDPQFASERTTQQWPKVGPGGLFWDNNDRYLHIDGDKTGEHSVWISVMDCEYLGKKNLRFRATDEVNNWARSEDLALDVWDFDLVMSGCPEQVDYDDPVNLMASLEGLPGVFSCLEDNIKWSVQKFEVSQWVDYGPNEDQDHQYEDSGYTSEFPINEDWLGTTFRIENFIDCGMRVRARIDICGYLKNDHCDIEVDSELEIKDMGIIVNDFELDPSSQGPALNYLLNEDLCTENINIPVTVSRKGAPYNLDYAVQVESNIDYSHYHGCIPLTLWTDSIVSSPTYETQPSINVELYLVTPGSSRHELFDNLFAPVSANKFAYYYSRGDSLEIGMIEPLVKICDDDDNPGSSPYIRISNDEGVDDYLDYNNADSAVAIQSCDQEQYGVYSSAINNISFGHSRGCFRDISECGSYLGEIGNWTGDVYDTGLEVIDISLAGSVNNLVSVGVQSSPDLFVIICHSSPEPSGTPDTPITYETVWDWLQSAVVDSLGGFYPNCDYFNYNELAEYGGFEDTEWLSSNACLLLNRASYPLWRTALINNGPMLHSICGFRIPVHRSNIVWSEAFSNYSFLLTNYAIHPGLYNEHLWDGNTVVPEDPSIKAWLETFCQISNSEQVPSENLGWAFQSYVSMYAAAINNDGRFVIKPRRADNRFAEFMIVEQDD